MSDFSQLYLWIDKQQTVNVWNRLVALTLEPSWGWLGADHLPSAASKPLDLHSPPQIATNSRELHFFCCDLSESILIGNINVMVSLPQPQSA